jgi:hypothetical protein
MLARGGGAKGSAPAAPGGEVMPPRGPAGPTGCRGANAPPPLAGAAVKGGPKFAATDIPVFAAAVMDGRLGAAGGGAMVAEGTGAAGDADGLAAPEAGRMTVTAPMACN